MSEFFGYGAPNATFWFVGMEEGGGDSFKEIERRLSCRDQRGRRQLEDLRAFHEAFGEHRWHLHRQLQKTWSHLIRIYLSANFRSTEEDVVCEYQVEKLGRDGEDTALLELFPLPRTPARGDSHSVTTIKVPKKLIEVALPLDDINVAAARAVLFAQMVNDPGGERGYYNARGRGPRGPRQRGRQPSRSSGRATG